jgi:hypothetical protein
MRVEFIQEIFLEQGVQMVWDQSAQTSGYVFKCGKCGGSEHYIAVQVMSQGKTNTFTKNVEVVTCKTCDVPMMRRGGKDEKAFEPRDPMKDFFRVFGVITAVVLALLVLSLGVIYIVYS